MSAIADFDRYDWALMVATCAAMMAAVLLLAELWVAAIVILIGLTIILVRDIRRYLRQHPATDKTNATPTSSGVDRTYTDAP